MKRVMNGIAITAKPALDRRAYCSHIIGSRSVPFL